MTRSYSTMAVYNQYSLQQYSLQQYSLQQYSLQQYIPDMVPEPSLYNQYYVYKPELLPKDATETHMVKLDRTEHGPHGVFFSASHIYSSTMLHNLLHHPLVKGFTAESVSPLALAPVIPVASNICFPTWAYMSEISTLSLQIDVGAVYEQPDISEPNNFKAILVREIASASLHDLLSALSPHLIELDIGFRIDGGFEQEYPADFGLTLPNVFFPKLEDLAYAGFSDEAGQFTNFLFQHANTLTSIALENVNLGSQSLSDLFLALKKLKLHRVTLSGILIGRGGLETVDFTKVPNLSDEFEETLKTKNVEEFKEWFALEVISTH